MNITELKQQLMADKKQLIILGALTAVCIGLWGYTVISGGLGNKSANRAAKPAAKKSVASTAKTKTVPGKTATTERKTVEVNGMYDRVHRDLFRFDATFYPGYKAPVAVTPLTEVEIVESTTTSQPTEVDREAIRRQIEQSVRSAARNLYLNSTMVGVTPRAVINQEIVVPGQQINGFEVKEIQSGRVILARQGVNVHLEL